MVLLIDADSLIYSSCLGVEDFDGAIAKFTENYTAIVNTLEETFTIDKVICFAKSKNNYRKIIDKKYKANRTYPKPVLWNEVSEELVDHFSMKQAYGMETDDLVATYWYNLSEEIGRDNVMIVSLDKDYKQLPALIYNYHGLHKTIYDIGEAAARKNFYFSMVIGDSADNVNYCKGYGIKYASKLFEGCRSDFQYTRKLYGLFKKIYKQKAREKYIQCYNLLCLAFWEKRKIKKL